MIIYNKKQNKYNIFSRINSVRGYSLVEIIIYLAIFTSISILVINLFITVLSSFNATNVNRKLLESGQISMQRISKEIRQAKNIDLAHTSLNYIQLNSTDELGAADVIKFSITSGQLNLYKNGILLGSLLNENITVTNLIFRRISTIQGEAVKIEMTLQYSDKKTTKSENFYDTLILRGEYF